MSPHRHMKNRLRRATVGVVIASFATFGVLGVAASASSTLGDARSSVPAAAPTTGSDLVPILIKFKASATAADIDAAIAAAGGQSVREFNLQVH